MIIHKQVIDFGGPHCVDLPADAMILHAAMQRGAFCIWYMFNEYSRPTREKRQFEIVPTGKPTNCDPSTHVATVLDGPYVWHLFELPGEPST